MDNPSTEISEVIHKLCQDSSSVQQQTIEKYFTPTASFTHPFCRTGSFQRSRWYIIQIYRWYKILSPKIEVSVNSVAFDEQNMLLYVSMHQLFKIWAVPFYSAPVNLTTVLILTNEPGTNQSTPNGEEKNRLVEGPKKYYIQSQNDLYQTSEFIKFVVPFGIGVSAVMLLQFIATFWCVVGAILGYPMTYWSDNVATVNTDTVSEVSDADMVDAQEAAENAQVMEQTVDDQEMAHAIGRRTK